jgi:hypothetical protein
MGRADREPGTGHDNRRARGPAADWRGGPPGQPEAQGDQGDQGDQRRAVAGQRERPADQRDHPADQRQDQADRREDLADEREARADQREAQADQREARADEREAVADQREARIDQLLRGSGLSTASVQQRALEAITRSRQLIARSAAAMDSCEALLRRQAQRAGREQSATDRETARSRRDVGPFRG